MRYLLTTLLLLFTGCKVPLFTPAPSAPGMPSLNSEPQPKPIPSRKHRQALEELHKHYPKETETR